MNSPVCQKAPAFLVLTCVLGATLGLAAASLPPVPAMPTPPQQGAPWSLPEGVLDPDGKVKTTLETLFKLGLDDPPPLRDSAIAEWIKLLSRDWAK